MSLPSTSIRVLVADGHPIVLEGLRSALGHQPGIQVVGEASDGMEAMELKLPRVDGLTVLRSIQARASRSKVILFSSSENKEEFVEAMKIGCRGIIAKSASISLIEKSIQKVHAGEIWLDSHTTAAVIRQFSSPSDFPAVHASNGKTTRERAQLSQREREIIILIAQGYKNKEIAEKMFITEQTVKNHLHNVFDKLGVSDRLELALYAIHNSLHMKA
jgi:two-component system nitrate/nitrite response regulator NarL